MKTENVIEIRNLKKAFGATPVLKGIDLDLHNGENIAILGQSGTGKSVLIKCIVGLITADSGTIKVIEKDLLDLNNAELAELRQKIGYLFQGGALYDSMTVRQNLEFPVRRTQILKGKKNEVNDMVKEALENVGLLDAIDKMPSELSGGMKKRVGLARTLILKPRIILYDEPTTGLDPVSSGEISELILEVQEKYNTSSIIITHDMKCAEITANRLKLMVDGKFYSEGTFNELKESDDKKINAYFK
ncbi:ABC transporter ATP-binding protein [Draconibacterium halophilum]|uniref:ATP-binding cassette domain-containing protein n=1 Tax=Draconibacterium halophilum TaxID=2706887 RepID=A0A6C0RH47_9BACT|nr:ATP-binding cassette domain-containing protein [Draconibacterium halophilum]QIA09326.1 ATP-binding cassette domain-containing protein [Draconibacterium halophilum]